MVPDKDAGIEAIKQAGINNNIRGEKLTLEEFVKLEKVLEI